MHPDYDYYERDRNASPGCYQPPGCHDCAQKHQQIQQRPPTTSRPMDYQPYPAPPPPPPQNDYNRPLPPPQNSYQRPQQSPPTDLEIYRPSSIYQPRPPLGPYYPSRPQNNPPAYGNQNIDRVGVEEEFYKGGNKYDEQIYYGYPGKDSPQPEYNRPPQEPIRPRPYPPPPPPGPPQDVPPHPPRNDYNNAPPSPMRPSSSYNSNPFIPYMINKDWGMYGGSYGGTHESYNQHSYWLKDSESRPNPPHFNYNELVNGRPMDYNSQYGDHRPLPPPPPPPHHQHQHQDQSDRGGNSGDRNPSYGQQWSRRPGVDDCSVKSSEGFRLHKGVVKSIASVPNVRDCERMCATEPNFKCNTFSFRYSSQSRDNCLLCERPYHHLDIYADLEPDRNYDIFSMSEDSKICKMEPSSNRKESNARKYS